MNLTPHSLTHYTQNCLIKYASMIFYNYVCHILTSMKNQVMNAIDNKSNQDPTTQKKISTISPLVYTQQYSHHANIGLLYPRLWAEILIIVLSQ